MSDTGWVFPSNPTSGTIYNGIRNWTNISNITADDTSWASITANFSDADVVDSVDAQNFDFGIPAGSTIDGIEFETEHKNSGQTWECNSAFIFGYGIKLINEVGSLEGTNRNTGPIVTGPSTKSFGSSSDLWGVTWLDTEVNDVDFGVSAGWAPVLKGGSSTGQINYVKLRITYTPPPFKPSCVVF